MKGKLYLSGGGDSEQTYNADKQVFQNVKKILYIPLAWDEDETYESCREWFESMLSLHKKIEYEMIKTSSANIELSNIDLIYIGGGNTFKLLKELKESDLAEKIMTFLNDGGLVYGGSAGAIIWGKSIEICQYGDFPDENKVNIKDFSGFNIVNGYDVQCHYDEKDFQSHAKYSKSKHRTIIAIPNEAVLEFDGKNFRVLGSSDVKLIQENKIKKISP